MYISNEWCAYISFWSVHVMSPEHCFVIFISLARTILNWHQLGSALLLRALPDGNCTTRTAWCRNMIELATRP